MASKLIQEVKHKQASSNTIYHVLYDYYFMGLNRAQLSRYFGKSPSTITNWITKFENEGTVDRKIASEVVYRKFSQEKREWVVELFKKKPILHRDEAKALFFEKFGHTISVTSITTILHNAGYSWKKLERRAIQLQLDDIVRYWKDLDSIPWFPQMLVFIDEVSFDSRDMLRKNGYGIKGQRLVYRGEFCRKPRSSLLCFLGYEGLLETCWIEGTFDRIKFVTCCKEFALDSTKNVQQYPGFNSVWIMDGARIHCSEKLVQYLRSLGIIVIFLPAYAPFLNPIEILFALAKQLSRKLYQENSKTDFNIQLGHVMNSFLNYPMKNLFKKCGYVDGKFDESVGLKMTLDDFGFESAGPQIEIPPENFEMNQI